MKKLSYILIVGISCLMIFHTAYGQNYDYLESTTATGNGITTDNSKLWTDLFSVTIDVTDISYLLVTASINMRPDGSNTNGREANYNIYRSDLTTDESGVIKRQLIRNSETGVESWGIGTLVHIFDVSSLFGDKTFILEHSNQGSSQTSRNVYSNARLTAVALTTETNSHELSNDVKRLDADVTTNIATYAVVTGLTTDAITLPIKGDIYVTASINGKAGGAGSVAEYKLEYSTDGGSIWADLGIPVKRSMVNSYDDGIVSLVGLLQDQDADNDFKFRVSHRRVSGTNTITTHNCNLVAVALAHNGGGYFPSFYSEVSTGVDITGVSASAAIVTSSSFTAAADISGVGTGLFVNAQYLVSATGLDASINPDQRMRAGNFLYVNDGSTTTSAEEYYRYIPDNDNLGSGGFIGLMSDLVDGGSYTIGMKHEVAYVSNPDGTEDETLTTSEIILTGFQTYDQAGYLWDGSASTVWTASDNWAYSVVPSSTAHDVTIPNVTNDPIITGTGLCECASLIVESGATFKIGFESKLTVSDVLNNSGTITIESTSAGTGSLIIEGTATGDIIVERYIADWTDGSHGWHILSSPVASQAIQPNFVPTTPTANEDFYAWDETVLDLPWINSKSGAGVWNTSFEDDFVVGKGYLVAYGPSSAVSHEFSGVPNTADVDKSGLTYTTGNSNTGWHLLGNPYPSALYWNKTTWGLTNCDATAKTWVETSASYTDIAASTGIIPAMQGFMVCVSTSATGSLSIDASDRTHNSQNWYKDTEINKLKLTVYDTEGSTAQESIIKFNDNATSGFDNDFDSRFMAGYAPQFYSQTEDGALSTNTLTDVESVTTIPMSFIKNSSSTYYLEVEGVDNLLPKETVYLTDLKTNHTQILNNNPVYNFTSDEGDNIERFVIHFSPLAIEEPESIKLIQIWAASNSINILNPTNSVGEIRLINMYGQEVMSTKLKGDVSQQISVNVSAGYYIVNTITNNGVINTKIYLR